MKTTAIILSAGKGKRMKNNIAKQYINVCGKPVLYYTIKAFEESNADDIIVVTGENESEYVKRNIIDAYGLKKVSKIVKGGAERYLSVYNALKEIDDSDYVLVHDGARPLVQKEDINNIIENVKETGACILAVRTKDTIKMSDAEGFVAETLERNRAWNIQTPQAFSYNLLFRSYEMALKDSSKCQQITDDSMIIEHYSDTKVAIVEGKYTNIKITTPEDLLYMEMMLRQ